jgi:hypothetical protein
VRGRCMVLGRPSNSATQAWREIGRPMTESSTDTDARPHSNTVARRCVAL